MPTLTQSDLDALRLDASVKLKNGVNFIVAAALVWLLISYLWTLPYGVRQKCLFTFIAGGVMLPLAWLFSNVFKTSWNLPDNPLQPLGLWLNVAQLAYFPILLFMYSKHPEHFLMVYVVITGAHLLPYAWFYNTRSFAVMSVLIGVGAVGLHLRLPPEQAYWLPLLMSLALVVLAVWLVIDYRGKQKRYDDVRRVIRAV